MSEERTGTARSPGSLWRTLLESLIAAALLVTFVVSGVSISGDSMEPSLHDGERALVPRFETWLHRLGVGSFSRGDVVYFPSPEQAPAAVCPWFCSHLIKRIVAEEGEVVSISRGQLLIDGRAVAEPYLNDSWRGSYSMAATVVPDDYVFVLGDNRGPYGSLDSRAFGAIPRRRLEGRAALVVWPLLRRDSDGHWRLNVRLLGRYSDEVGSASRPSSSSSSARPCIASSTNFT